MIHIFGKPEPQLSILTNNATDYLYDKWNHLFNTMNQPWLSPDSLESFATAIYRKGAPLSNCWGFSDGTVRPVYRPGLNQRILYNGHKRVHSIKFQSVIAPYGLIANLFGPVEGKRHGSGTLAMSNLLPQLVQHSIKQNGDIMCIYGDPLRPQLQAPFKGANLLPHEKEWNKEMSAVRVSVEWIFRDIIDYFKFLGFKKNLKLGKMYTVAALLHNARPVLYETTTSTYFDIAPPSLNDYFL